MARDGRLIPPLAKEPIGICDNSKQKSFMEFVIVPAANDRKMDVLVSVVWKRRQLRQEKREWGIEENQEGGKKEWGLIVI